jgi:hypothetical protein
MSGIYIDGVRDRAEMRRQFRGRRRRKRQMPNMANLPGREDIGDNLPEHLRVAVLKSKRPAIFCNPP